MSARDFPPAGSRPIDRPVRPCVPRPAWVAALLLAAWTEGANASGLVRWSGGKTPALELAQADGQPLALSEWRGKTVVVNFWATWCEPCRDEMPSLDRLKARLPKVEVLAVNVGESPERVARFTKDVPVTFPIVFDRDGATARRWQVRGYPTTFVVGPDGRIRYYYVGELDWSSDAVARVVEGLR